MELRKRLLLLAGSLVVFNLVLWGIPKLAPEAPGRYEGVSVAEPSKTSPQAPTTTPAPLPSGFPTMEYPPPKIIVPDGEPQPIATKFGLTYDIPADWRNVSGGVAGWTTGGESVVYGAIGDYGYKYCPESDGSALALSGMTGRTETTIDDAALSAARDAEVVFGNSDAAPPRLQYSQPYYFKIQGEPAVRYTVRAENIHRQENCDPHQATFDVVATTGFATAPIAVFMIELHQGLPDALNHSIADAMISTIRRSDFNSGGWR
ncbi:hypothetical protein [Rhodococcoides fascians]|uniref:hypothetical protein n=1 Tax=Rhodococcoides fascians TaxID=1828 RepID=UPI0012D2A646|nr:hypothetical protein [Rhodococcus fascians]